MKVFVNAGVALVLSGTAAMAQQWSVTEGGGIRNASIASANTSIIVSCATDGTNQPNAIQLNLGETAAVGPVSFAFDGNTTVAGIFADGVLRTDSPQNDAVFALLRDALKSRNVVTVSARNLPIQTFSLRGSRRAIGDCPIPTRLAAAPAPAPATESTETPQAAPQPTTAVVPGDVTPTQPIPDDPFIDHRIADCTGTRGLMLMNYDTLNGVTELSDFCFNEAEGTLLSSEPRAGFALAEDSDDGRAFEIPETGNDRFSRVRVDFGEVLGCGTQLTENAVNYAIPDGLLARNAETLFLYARGLTVADSARNARDLFNTETTLLSIRDFSVRRITPATTETALLPEGADMRGVFTASGRQGSLDITNGNGFWVGDAEGALSFTVEADGDVIGSGKFTAKNQRLVGQEDHDWVTMTAEIPYLRGYVLGNDGSVVMAYGVVRGSYFDASNKTHQFEASATFTACAES